MYIVLTRYVSHADLGKVSEEYAAGVAYRYNNIIDLVSFDINPWRACTVRVTVVVVWVCHSFCLLCENSLLKS